MAEKMHFKRIVDDTSDKDRRHTLLDDSSSLGPSAGWAKHQFDKPRWVEHLTYNIINIYNNLHK